MSTNQAQAVLNTMSPTMCKALTRIYAGDHALHGREIASLHHRGLVTTDMWLTKLGSQVHDLIKTND